MEKHERTNKRESGVIVGSRSEQSRVGQGIVFRGSRALWIFSKIPRVTTSRRSLILPDGKEVATVNTVVYRSLPLSLFLFALYSFLFIRFIQIERRGRILPSRIFIPPGASRFFFFSLFGEIVLIISFLVLIHEELYEIGQVFSLRRRVVQGNFCIFKNARLFPRKSNIRSNFWARLEF